MTNVPVGDLMRKFLSGSGFGLLLLLFLPSIGAAQIEIFPKGGLDLRTDEGKIRIGRVEIHPGLALESRYDSNVFQEANKTFENGTSEDKDDDFIFTISPSIGINLERGKGELLGFDFKYIGNSEHFVNLSSEDTFEHDVNASVNFGGPGGRTDVTLGGRYFKTRSIQDRDLQSNLGARQDEEDSKLFANLVYILSETFRVRLNGDFRREDFSGSPGIDIEDVDTINLGGAVFWQITQPTAIGVRYNHRIRDYLTPSTTNFDGEADAIFFLVKWEPTKLLRSEVELGYETKRFDNISGQDVDDFVFNVDVEYSPTQRRKFLFNATRQIQDSSFRLIQAFIYTAAEGSVLQRLGRKFSTRAGFQFENLDYQKSAVDNTSIGGVSRVRVDNTITGTLAVIYDIQSWLKAEAEYKYEQNFSNFDDRDYEQNVGTLRLSATY